MPSPQRPFRESNLYGAPIRDLKLAITDTRLAPVIDEFRAELKARGLTKITPTFYLSTEWGVAFGTVAIGIPFYLARPELTELHGEEVGHIEGFNHADILRYLRHEMGHVLNYAYKLYDDESWVKVFGSITQPYREEYRPQPFSRRFVRHLPGWYAQKHPDEDWAETFAVWMTPKLNWRADYAQWPSALAKLELCDRLVATFAVREPLVTSTERDEDVAALDYSLREFYKSLPAEPEPGAAGLDGDLRAIFDDLIESGEAAAAPETRPAGELIRRLERQLMADVFRWTGHFPEKTRSLMRDLAKRADSLRQVYPRAAEAQAIVGVTTLVTSLAMNFVHRGAYFPETAAAAAGSSQSSAAPSGSPSVSQSSAAARGGGGAPTASSVAAALGGAEGGEAAGDANGDAAGDVANSDSANDAASNGAANGSEANAGAANAEKASSGQDDPA